MHFQVLALFHDVDDSNSWAAPSIHLLLCEYFNLLRHDIYFALYRVEEAVFLELKRVSNFSLEKKKRKISFLWKKTFFMNVEMKQELFCGYVFPPIIGIITIIVSSKWSVFCIAFLTDYVNLIDTDNCAPFIGAIRGKSTYFVVVFLCCHSIYILSYPYWHYDINRIGSHSEKQQ